MEATSNFTSPSAAFVAQCPHPSGTRCRPSGTASAARRPWDRRWRGIFAWR